MKHSKQQILALAVAAACSAPMVAHATNGDELIGLGAQSRALGGTGTAAFFGSENALSNPGLLGKAKGTEFAFGGTLFMPKVKSSANIMGTPTSSNSAADRSLIPEVSSYTRIDDNLVFGIGMYGTAGMGVDYRNDAQLFQAFTSLQLMKFAPTLAYNQDKFGIGFSPVIQYGALNINYKTPAGTTGNGVSSDTELGYSLGGYFDVSEQLTLGLAYQSAIDMKYKDQITGAADGFRIGPGPLSDKTITSEHLEQPAEYKLGVAYTMDRILVTADYKKIAWSSAKGYKDFNWKDQDVFGLGVKYSGEGYWLGAGYNHGNDPIKKLSATSYDNEAINLFNNLFFPAVVENHFTVGGGKAVSKNITLEGAIVVAPETSKTVDTGIVSNALSGGAITSSSQKVTHSQTAYTVSMRMNF